MHEILRDTGAIRIEEVMEHKVEWLALCLWLDLLLVETVSSHGKF